MKYLILAICLMAVSPIAAADSSSAQSNSSSQASASGGMGGNSSSISQGGNGFGGIGGEGGTGGSGYGAGGIGTGTGGSASNTQSLHLDQVRQSPAVFMNAPMPTAVCQATMGGFLSFIGGIGLAGSRTLEECELRELSRTAYGIGQPAMALHVLCKAKYAQDFEGCRGRN